MKLTIELDVAEDNTLAKALAERILIDDNSQRDRYNEELNTFCLRLYHASYEVIRARNIAIKCGVHNKVNRILHGRLSSITEYAIKELDRQGHEDSRGVLWSYHK